MTATTADTTLPESTDSEPIETPGPPPARRWERLALIVLLLGTAVAYLWNITVNRMGNSFYAAAAWSGSRSWKAVLFGSLDPSNFITVDKPPVSQWVMGISGQLFGFSSASMLVPEALMAVVAVALLYSSVTGVTGSRGAGLLAGLALAVTPVAALMFRFNNPDAAMVLAMTAAAWCTTKALPKASVRWLMWAGVALGFAFLAKMLEGLMVLPALALAYLLVAPTTLGKRVLHLLAAAAALIVSSGWYVLLTILWPSSSRPYLAGSTNDTFMDLVLGYNGFARYLGHNHHGRNLFQAPPGYEFPRFGGGGGGFGGNGTGPTRMFAGEIGFEISWLLPAAVVAFLVVLVLRWRTPRTDLVRGAAVLFGLWLLIDAVAFSAMQGGMHAYYTLAIAPAVAGSVALGAFEAWRRRGDALGRGAGALLVAAAGGWAFVLLHRNADWQPWLRWTILAVTAVAVVVLLATTVPPVGRRVPVRATAVLLALGLVGGLAGSTAYAAATLPESHTGGGPSVGPARPDAQSGVFAMFRKQLMVMMGGSDYDPQLVSQLQATRTRWAAAIDRSGPAAGLELAGHIPVMAIGGFTSEDPTPTLARFQDLVHTHQISYYLAAEVKLPDAWRTDKSAAAKSDAAPYSPAAGWWHPVGDTEIYDWVSAHYPARHLDGLVVYDLTADPH
ncbi:ArnT family glycosyltransferase [Nocardia sp. alder85J]|uniref:ArnT family glycosyltransferase n=1 Tax=Nocardia sp. alder85J TaxID=2862949 RepID=UPI001CD333B2|nr:glycosyltransferase family 39 protein [Nocardia sp. alder85J]MCX4091693.1 glycosyltransferase family 39 protein [Nocardia sp. alder85J]